MSSVFYYTPWQNVWITYPTKNWCKYVHHGPTTYIKIGKSKTHQWQWVCYCFLNLNTLKTNATTPLQGSHLTQSSTKFLSFPPMYSNKSFHLLLLPSPLGYVLIHDCLPIVYSHSWSPHSCDQVVFLIMFPLITIHFLVVAWVDLLLIIFFFFWWRSFSWLCFQFWFFLIFLLIMFSIMIILRLL